VKLKTLFLAPLIFATCTGAQPTEKMAATIIQQRPSGAPASPAESVLLNGIAAEWQATGNGDLAYLKSAVDRYVAADGTIPGYTPRPQTLDEMELGRNLLFVYRATQEKKYALAAEFLHQQLATQPRTPSGLYAHSQNEPQQVWLSDAYAVEPFRAAYAATFQQPEDFDDISKQLLLLDTQLRDPKSGLLRAAWDESKSAPGFDKTTGLSPEVLAQPMGVYAMALVDTLDWFPKDNPQRPALIAALNRTIGAILKVQESTGLWWQVMDRAPHHTPAMHRQPDGSIRLSVVHEDDGNFLEVSASSMFAYALAKGTRLGYLPPSDQAAAQRAWDGIQKKFITTNPDGTLTLHDTAKLASPTSNFDAAIHQPQTDQDPIGIGAFLLAGSEIDQIATPSSTAAAQSPTPARTGLLPSSKDFHAPTAAPQPSTRRVTAMVDAWFNSQTRKNALGQTEPFHYKWDDDSINGYSVFGRAFERHHADLAMLPEAPTRANLAQAQIYVIASPDIPVKNPNPHYMDQLSGDAIESWVRSGGVLILFSNDRDNTEFTHFNTLADRFGIHFNPVLSHHVIEPDHSGGEVVIPSGTGIFGAAFTAYMKDTSTITPSGPAKAVVTDHGDVMIAISHVGKGTVLAIVDPWIYNEYADGRKMRQYRGFEAADDIAAWAVHQAQLAKGSKP
jgi:unsaturated rhamnogalacturonyl hydrolase